MGRQRKCTVEIRETSIRLKFTLDSGERVAETLTSDGRQPLAPTGPNSKFAHHIANEITEALRRGTFSYSTFFPHSERADDNIAARVLTVGAQLGHWEKTLRIAESTKGGYSSAVKFWKNAVCDDEGSKLGAVSLRDLRLSQIKRAIASRPDLSGKTINNYVSVLREAIQIAVSDEILKTNPAADKSLRASHQKPTPDPFTIAEAEKIIAHARKHFPDDVANLIEAWFFSGFRTSEIFGLRWGAIDWNLRKVQVSEALVRGRHKAKTKTSVVREIAMNSRSEAALRQQKKHTFMAGELVFMDSRYGEPWNEERAFRRSYWQPALKACGIRYRRPYNMRHTFATMLLMSGATPAYAAEQMGHSVDQFLKTYAKWQNDGHQVLEQQRLERFIAGQLPGSVPESSPEMKTGA